MPPKKTPFITSVQDQDISYREVPAWHGKVHCMFYRSKDSLLYDTDGQDYLKFRDDGEKERFCFVICDGVGQSYFGQLAAEFLGDYLFSWLESLDTNLLENPNLAKDLFARLNNLVDEAQQMVMQHELPPNLPDLQLMALLEQKKYGSEAIFVAGYVDFTQVSKKRHPVLNVFWLGDTQIHLFDQVGNELEFPDRWLNSERWSTRLGVKGREVINHWRGELKNVSKLVVHSDGIKLSAERLFNLIDDIEEMQSVVRTLRASPESDDISLIAFDIKMPEKKWWILNKKR